jgi:hypothetical protein
MHHDVELGRCYSEHSGRGDSRHADFGGQWAAHYPELYVAKRILQIERHTIDDCV